MTLPEDATVAIAELKRWGYAAWGSLLEDYAIRAVEAEAGKEASDRAAGAAVRDIVAARATVTALLNENGRLNSELATLRAAHQKAVEAEREATARAAVEWCAGVVRGSGAVKTGDSLQSAISYHTRCIVRSRSSGETEATDG